MAKACVSQSSVIGSARVHRSLVAWRWEVAALDLARVEACSVRHSLYKMQSGSSVKADGDATSRSHHPSGLRRRSWAREIVS